MARVLVTGGAGFIGSHLCEALLNIGHTVICLDNFSSGCKSNVESLREYKNFQLWQGDVCDVPGLPVRVIFHLASPASPAQYSQMPAETFLANGVGTHNLLRLAEKYGARFILGSTAAVYGEPEVTPQPESYWGRVNPAGPRSCYHEGKRMAEALTVSLGKSRGIEYTIMRIFNTYGPRMAKNDGRVIPNFISQALAGEPLTVYGDGSQTRCFCHVDDLVKGMLAVLDNDEAIGKVVNLGNTSETTIRDLADLVLKVSDSTGSVVFNDLPDGDPSRRRPDIKVAKDLLKWRPRVSLEAGLGETIDWYQRQIRPKLRFKPAYDVLPSNQLFAGP